MPAIRLFFWIACAALSSWSGGRAQAQTIANTASLTYIEQDGERTILSNTVTLNRLDRQLTQISFRQPGPGYTMRGVACATSPSPRITPSSVLPDDLAASAPFRAADRDDPIIIQLVAPGENLDPTVRDTTEISIQTVTLRGTMVLTETAPNSGIFAGAIPGNDPASNPDCDVTVARDGQVQVSFADTLYSKGSTAALLIDPEGYVFNSRTGAVVNGAIVTLIDEATGQPARVLGDDGVSDYPATVTVGDLVVDSRGDRYQLKPGGFRFPLVAAGRYRLRIVPPPGYAAPSIVTPEAIATLASPLAPFLITEASYGGVLVVEGNEPIRSDIPVDPSEARGALVLEKEASVRVAEPGDFVQYRLDLRNTSDRNAANIIVTDHLPAGLRYRSRSVRGAAEPQRDSSGRSLTFSLPSLGRGASIRITYLVEVVPGAPVGEAINRARPSATGFPDGNEASAAVRIRAPLFTDAMTVIGRITEGACGDPAAGRKGVAGIRLIMEDGSFVVTDADGFYHFDGVRAGTHVVQIDSASIPRTHAPIACDTDTRAAGSMTSRFVEGGGGSLQRVDFQLAPTGVAAASADMLPITPADDAAAAGNRPDWLAEAAPGIGWLFPGETHNPRAPALRVVIRHGPDQRVALRINGAPVDPLSFDGTDADRTRGVAVSRWTGLPLQDRANRLQAQILAADGHVVQTLERVVHYANHPARATFVAEHSRLVADGLTRPLVAVRVTDRDGRPVRSGTTVPFRLEPPYLAHQEAALQQGRQLAGLERAETTARVVGDDGLAFIALQPTRQAGRARIAITLADEQVRQTSEIEAWLSAPPRDWVVVGFGRGTVGYGILSRAEPLPGDGRNALDVDGQLALYASGRIRGSWLLTMAYDSDRRRDPDRGYLGAIDPDRYYTVYGDGAPQGHDAPTRGKLYVRLERREFYALYGDFETGLVDTRLARHSRTMNGVKAEYAGNRVNFTAFAANDDSRYGRDEIQGNGLSGPYRLSARGIVPNSDKLRLETRDRYRSERIVDSRPLTRHIDYDIDPMAGTLRFREPILSRDAELNPIFIVADYEVDGGTRAFVAGGRAAAKIGSAEIGASLLRDESVTRNAMVAAADLRLRLGSNTEIRAEAATGGRNGVGSDQAWLAEIEHHGSRADVLAYARQQDAGFGLGQQNPGEAGTRKVGIDARLRVSERLHFAGSAWYQDQLQDPGRRLAGEARLEYRRGQGTLFTGIQFASDRGLGTAGDRASRLLTLGGTQSLLDNRLQIEGQAQLAVSGKNDSIDFPTRQRIGARWRFNEAVRIIADYEVAEGETYRASTARVGFDLAPWAGTRLLATLNQGAIGENGTRTFAQYGISQSLPLGRRWTIDATLDASSTLRGRVEPSDLINPYHPPASGGVLTQNGLEGDFVAATLGAAYRSKLWSWNGRIEYRDGEREERWGLTSNLLRTLGRGSTVASGVRAYRVRDEKGAVTSSFVSDLALAVRPLDSRWSLLERFQLRHHSADAGALPSNSLAVPVLANGVQATTRAVNNFAINYHSGEEGLGHGFEASFYHGAKYVRGRYADERIDGFFQALGAEIRFDLGKRFDIGAQASAQHSWTGHKVAFSAGPSAGVSPGNNLWVTAGYNVVGYHDRDFEGDRWTRHGPYLTLRLKFGQNLFGRRR